MHKRIGILAIALIALIAASTAPAIAGPTEDTSVAILLDPLAVVFKDFAVGDPFVITITNGLGPGANIAQTIDGVIGEPNSDNARCYTVYLVTGECDCGNCIELDDLKPGRYTLSVTATHDGTDYTTEAFIVVKDLE